MPDQTYTSDQPISKKEEDRFNRWPFAVRVADTLTNRADPSSLIVAIYGPWGDGKTSVLKMMEERLSDRADVTVVPFNPWYFEGQTDLIRAFFQTVADALGAKLSTKVEELGQFLKKYGSLLSSVKIPGLPVPDASKVGETLSGVTLDQLRGRIEAALSETGQRLVVLMDDIDRLDRSEIQLLFKLIKLSAGFQHLSYVLAFDDEVVADSLGERYGAGGIEAGRRFLEKIVQVPLHLPPADRLSLRQIAFEGVDAAIRSAALELSESDVQVFVRRFVEGLEPRLTTPRQAKRYGNAVAFAIPILIGEVHVVDQLLIEGVRVFYPVVYDTIRRNPDVFLGSNSVGGNGDAYREKAREIFDAMTANLPKEEREAVEELLKELFPRLQSVFGNMYYGDDSYERWDREQRICTKTYFDRYFRYAVPPRDIGDREFTAFVQSATASTTLSDSISRFCQNGGASRFIAKLRRVEGTIPTEAAQPVALAIAKAGDLFPVEKQMFARFASTRGQAAVLLYNLLKRIPDADQRCSVAKEVAAAAAPLPFAIEWFWWLRPGKEDKEPPILSEECVSAIGLLIAGRIETAAAAAPPYASWADEAPSILWLWKTYGPPSVVENYLLSRFGAEPREAALFLMSFVPTAWGLESGLSFKSAFERSQYNSAVEFVAGDLILSKLKEVYGDELNTSDFYQSKDVPLDLRVARQFAYVHSRVVEEAAAAGKSAGTNADGITEAAADDGPSA